MSGQVGLVEQRKIELQKKRNQNLEKVETIKELRKQMRDLEWQIPDMGIEN